MGILPILSKHFLLVIEICKRVCRIEGHPIYEIERVMFLPFEKEEAGKEPEAGQYDKIQEIKNYIRVSLLVEGYYFAYRYNLSLSRSAYANGYPSKKKFFWNYSIGKNF